MAISVLLAFACVNAAADTPPADRVQIAADPAALADFTLTDQDGRDFAFRSLRGRDALVFFGFTHCPTACPAAMFKLRLLTEAMREAGEEVPAVVLISVDGERDTPAAMKAYLAGYPGEFIGLTGDPKAVRKIAAEFKAVFFKGLPADESGDYLVEHTSQVYLVDGQGRLRATFFNSPVEVMARATRSLNKHAS
jgi:protein SCO1/2